MRQNSTIVRNGVIDDVLNLPSLPRVWWSMAHTGAQCRIFFTQLKRYCRAWVAQDWVAKGERKYGILAGKLYV